MVPALLAIAGAVGGGFATSQAAQDQQDMMERAAQMRTGLGGGWMDALSSDPLMAYIMGSAMTAQNKQPMDTRKIFLDASKQIEAMTTRRRGDVLKSMAGYGFVPGSAQEQYMQRQLSKNRVQQIGALDQAMQQQQISMEGAGFLGGAGTQSGAVGALKSLQVSGL